MRSGKRKQDCDSQTDSEGKPSKWECPSGEVKRPTHVAQDNAREGCRKSGRDEVTPMKSIYFGSGQWLNGSQSPSRHSPQSLRPSRKFLSQFCVVWSVREKKHQVRFACGFEDRSWDRKAGWCWEGSSEWNIATVCTVQPHCQQVGQLRRTPKQFGNLLYCAHQNYQLKK